MIVDVWVRVCCATGVTTAGREEVLEVEVDEVVDEVDEVDEVVDEDELVDLLLFPVKDEVLEVVEDVGELPAEDVVGDALDVLSFVGLGILVGLGKRIDIITAQLSLLEFLSDHQMQEKNKNKNKKREWVEWPAQGCYAAISIQKNDIIHY